jgi:integrase
MKKERDHMVPLSQQVVELFREMLPLSGRSKYVFPNVRDRDRPMSNGAILMALRRMGYQGEMTGHGFRSLGMSAIKQELGYLHEIVDLQLAHVKKNKVDAAYDRAKFLKERTKMMQEWADYIDTLAST